MLSIQFDLDNRVLMGTFIIPASRARRWAAGEQPSRLVSTVWPVWTRRLAIEEPIAPAVMTDWGCERRWSWHRFAKRAGKVVGFACH